MSKCICNSCQNLKSVFYTSPENEDEREEMLECEYDFPSEDCVTCELEGCELSCEHYISDEIEEIEEENIAYCVKCGKELRLTSSNKEKGDVYCVTCYLSNN